MHTQPLDLDALLAHDGFVRSLARRLLDEDAAEDAVQQTWLAALTARVAPTSLRAWLATVVRNEARDRVRAEASRAERERAHPRMDATPPVDAMLERESARRAVVDAVSALEEPYRTTLVLRYFDGLPPRAIARRTGEPVETIRTRIKRGLATLRARLDARHGGRAAWAAWLLPLAEAPSAAGSVPASSAGLSTPAKVAAAAAVATLAVSFGLLAMRSDPERDGVRRTATVDVASARDPREPSSEVGADRRRVGEPNAAELPGVALHAEAATLRSGSTLVVHARWRDDRTRAPHVTIGLAPKGPWAMEERREIRSDEQGDARIELEPGTWTLWARSVIDGWQGEALVEAGAVREVEVLVDRGYRVVGRVLDERGAAVEGAHVWAFDGFGPEGPAGLRVDQLVREDGRPGLAGLPKTRSGPDGRFALDAEYHQFLAAYRPGHAVGMAEGARGVGVAFLARELARGTPADRIGSPIAGKSRGEVELDVVLREPEARIAGRVLGFDGRPAENAEVVAQPDPAEDAPRYPCRVVTAANGEFDIAGLPPGGATLHVRTETDAPFSTRVEARVGAAARVDVQLDAGATVVGRATDLEGKPVEGAFIEIRREGVDADPRRRAARWATTDGTGTLRLTGLPAGRVLASAHAPGWTATLDGVLDLTPLAETRWDPVLPVGR
ncbi:MAG TPA: sigma-70 family RNA polymerase sigma factor [Planctomycetota bacterium]|nr:sigma-70 family RNA polymerase sigma factor [Planctomycetota bacterium]